MATLIKTDGTKQEVSPKNGKAFTYEELHEFVGGNIDTPVMPSGRCLVVNDEGKLAHLPKNDEASKIWQEEYPIDKFPFNNDELIVGDALLLSEAEYDAMNDEDLEEEEFVAKKVL